MAMAKTLESYLLQHGVEYELVPHPKTYTSRDTAKAAHVADDHIAKAVIVRDEQGHAMVVIPASHWLKLEALQQEADRDFVLAAESDATKLFHDCAPGAIPPLGPAYGLETFLDERLTSLANVYFEAGDHEDLVHVNGDAFHVLLKGVRHGHFSHDD
ncbi:MAG: YbaK/EbsC family protein [Gammaproteobacteria bacterium]|nr:YbaK/EbsC family protein [Gammaproteobacteria bacterium]